MVGRIIIILLSFSFMAKGQLKNNQEPTGDGNKNIVLRDRYDEPDLIDRTFAQVEIRLYQVSGSAKSITVLQYDKNKFFGYHWALRSVGMVNIDKSLPGGGKPQPKTTSLRSNNLDSLFFELVRNNIFKLPDQSKLTKEHWRRYNRIEFKVNGELGSYSFDTPSSFPSGENTPTEFENFKSIVTIFKQIISRSI